MALAKAASSFLRAFLWELHPAQKQASLWASMEEQAELQPWAPLGRGGWCGQPGGEQPDNPVSSLCFLGSADSLIKY